MSKKTATRCARCGKLRRLVPGLSECGHCRLAAIHSPDAGKAAQAVPQASTAPLRTRLLTLAEADAMFERGVNRQVLHQAARVLVESYMDPATGLEVNRLTCVGDSWPEPPLAAVLRGEKESTA